MKIIYYSQTFFADCDFPLVGALQKKGHDVRYYLPISTYNLRSTLLDIKQIYPHTGIYPASIYKELDVYKEEIDLSKLYIINQVHKQKYHPLNIILMLRVFVSFIIQKPDIIQLTLPPVFLAKILYLVRDKLVLTLHDPFLHSGRKTKKEENNRTLAFRKIRKLILLNKKQATDFSKFYKVPLANLFFSKLGKYDSINYVKPLQIEDRRPFILYFGLIAEYKGVEFLLEAMKQVHIKHPELKLVVAGGGRYYFDLEDYNHLDYIDIQNRYIGVAELSGLLSNCLYSVCPYKDATQSGVVQTAFSLGCPLIVTNVGALGSSVSHEENGLVVPPCDVDSLALAMCRLLDDSNLLNKMRKNIIEKWQPSMEWDQIADDYIDCYKS